MCKDSCGGGCEEEAGLARNLNLVIYVMKKLLINGGN
jgi:hypothetical protein